MVYEASSPSTQNKGYFVQTTDPSKEVCVILSVVRAFTADSTLIYPVNAKEIFFTVVGRCT